MRPSLPFIATLLLLLLVPGCPDTSPGGYDYHTAEEDTGGPTLLDITAETGPLPDLPALPDAETAIPPDVAPESVPHPDLTTPDVPDLPEWRDCTLHLTVTAPGEASVALAAEFTDWATNELPLEDPDGDSVWELALDASTLTPGNYGYKFHTGSDL